MRSHLLTGLILLLLADSAGASEPFRPDPATVRRHGPAYRYPQAGWTVLHIEGEPYDRGYQHGRLLAAEIAGYLKNLAAQQSAKDPSAGWKLTRTIVGAVFLRKFDREYLEEMKGIADGAAAAGATFDGRPVDLTDIAGLNLCAEWDTLDAALEALPTGLEGLRFPKPPAPRGPPARQAEHCSAFIATGPATADGKIVLGHITMWNLAASNAFNIWLDLQPATGHRIVMQTFPGGIQSGMDYYLNSAGLMVAETTIHQTRYNPDGIPVANRIRKALQYGSTIDDAVKILTEKNNGLYTNEWLLGDANSNEIAVLELGTTTHRLRRSSKSEWLLPGAEGFYWGCNNTKDLQVRLDTIASLSDRPQDVSWRPSDRDRAWLRLYQKHRGKVDADFGKLAFATPPIAARPSLDAKVTTSALAKQLKSHALFGPPFGRVWHATDEEKITTPDIRPLVPNDWAILMPAAPVREDVAKARDVFEKVGDGPAAVPDDPPTVPAWHGTLLPKSDADVWVTAAFAAYERVVAFESALREQSDGKLTSEDRNRIDLALFRFRSDLRAAGAKHAWLNRSNPSRPKIDPPTEFDWELIRSDWHKIEVGYGVLTFDALRRHVGRESFAKAMDAFGRANAGKQIVAGDLIEFLGRHSGKDVAAFLKTWNEKPDVSGSFAVTYWLGELDQSLIVYGTTRDEAANRESAHNLRNAVRDRRSNIAIPVKADREVTDADLQGRHVVLIGRPATNAVTSRFESAFPVTFCPASCRVKETLYAHEGTSIIAAGENPADPRFSAVVIAGLSADATFTASSQFLSLVKRPCEVLAIYANGTSRPLLTGQTKHKSGAGLR